MDIIYRNATLQDKDATLNLVKDFFSGLDYLPAVYNTWYHDRRYTMWVAEYNGKVVSIFQFRVYLSRGIYTLVL